MKGKSRMECMVKCSLVILHVFQGCLEFQTQLLRVRSSSCAMPLYTLDMKAKLSLLVHHDCNLRLYIMHRLMVKKLSQYLVGCWNIMIHCASAHVVYFKLGVLVFFNLFLYQTIQANPLNLAKEDIFCFPHGSNAITVYAFTAILPC